MHKQKFHGFTSDTSLVKQNSKHENFSQLNQHNRRSKKSKKSTSTPPTNIKIPLTTLYERILDETSSVCELDDTESDDNVLKSQENYEKIKFSPKSKFDQSKEKPNSTDVQPKAVRHRAITSRLLKLSEPKEHYDGKNLLTNDKSSSSPLVNYKDKLSSQSLNLKSLNRINELAKPKKTVQLPKRKNPFGVNPKALTAKCPPRIEELAQPKVDNSKFKNIIDKFMNRLYLGP